MNFSKEITETPLCNTTLISHLGFQLYLKLSALHLQILYLYNFVLYDFWNLIKNYKIPEGNNCKVLRIKNVKVIAVLLQMNTILHTKPHPTINIHTNVYHPIHQLVTLTIHPSVLSYVLPCTTSPLKPRCIHARM